jgi:predicted HTH domain antitoxin
MLVSLAIAARHLGMRLAESQKRSARREVAGAFEQDRNSQQLQAVGFARSGTGDEVQARRTLTAA